MLLLSLRILYDFVNKCSDLFTFKPIKKLLDWKIYQSFAKTIFKAHYILSTLHIFIPISGRSADFSGTLNLGNLLLYLLMFKGCKFSEYFLVWPLAVAQIKKKYSSNYYINTYLLPFVMILYIVLVLYCTSIQWILHKFGYSLSQILYLIALWPRL